MDKDKARTAFDIIKSLNQLQDIRDILSKTMMSENGTITIGSSKSMCFVELRNEKEIHNVLRGIDKRVAELEKELYEL